MARMRPRISVTADQIIAALEAADGHIEEAAAWLGTVWGIEMSGRTLRRRMRDLGVRPRTGYERVENKEAA